MPTTRRDFLRGAAAAGPLAALPQSGAGATAAADFYIAPGGSDQHDGTEERPFSSLERARRAVLELRSRQPLNRPVTVLLRGGTYRMSRPVVFSGRDSGTEASPTVYAAYPGEQPV